MTFLLSLLLSTVHAAEFKITSHSLKDGGVMPIEQVFDSFGCTGKNVSPDLAWTAAPAGTKSFAVTAYDPDAPTGSGWWHWTVFNIPATTTALAKGAGNEGGTLPAGAGQGRTDFGRAGYGGACPPPGDKPHRYIFTVHALKTDKLELDQNASGAMVGFYLGANTLAKATLTVRYSR